MKFPIILNISTLLFSLASGHPNFPREKRQVSPGIQKVLQDLASRVTDIEEGQEGERDALNSIKGFFNAIGVGGQSIKNAEHDPCGGWTPLTDSKCIKLMPSVYTMEEAIEACAAEYTQDLDLESPKVLSINASLKQKLVTTLLRSGDYSSLTSFWIVNSGDFSNWGSGSPSNQPVRSCTELRNDGNPSQTGKWLDVTCDRKNSLICEKTLSLSYLQLVEKVLNLLKRGPSNEDVVKLQRTIIQLETELARIKDQLKQLTTTIPQPKSQLESKMLIDFEGKIWAFNCDFVGNDIINLRSKGEDCSEHCKNKAECTNFSWTGWTYDGEGPGTCWLKRGNLSAADAVRNDYPWSVCGYIAKN